ncbi:MAG TPA: lycopene cyclase family protein, partial [Longimicrobium sp.]|nr:lycopene cyclase family protein [Longimicrobium sp.]
MLDALVIGKGPAGLAAAAALAETGLSVAVAGPREAPWTAVYGAWMDDLEAAGCPAFVQNTWTRVTIDAGAGPRDLGRTYARIDNAGLAAALRERIEGRGGAWIDGTAASAAHRREGSAVTFEDGRTVEARVVVEATGHRPRLVVRTRTPEPAYQTAVGWTLATDAHPYTPDQAVLMDWSDGHLPREARREPATFLYAFPLGGGRLFVEETALAARPQADADFLRGRLERRLAHLGIAGTRVGGEERVWIPMGGAIPKPQRVIGFGAA